MPAKKKPTELRFDPERALAPPPGPGGPHFGDWLEPSGIPIRAKRGERYDTGDIVELDKESLLAWLASRDDMDGAEGKAWRDNVILILLGHP